MGLTWKALEWVNNNPTIRMKFTKIGPMVSELEPVKVGVPQGSVRGPLLFILHINDFEKPLETTNLYADDTIIYI